MKYAVVVLSLALAIFMVIDFNGRLTELNRLRAEEVVVSSRLEGQLQTKSGLEAQIAFATSDAAVIKWAYENHMARPGDLRVVPIQIDPITPAPTPIPMTVVVEVHNLDRWLSLFVDPAANHLTP
jgi:hypothetical protein